MQNSKDSLSVVFSKEQIDERINELAKNINEYYREALKANEQLLVVCVLRGAVLFFADLVRHLEGNIELDFVRIASYGKSTSSSGHVNFIKDLEIDIQDKHVLIVEDIVDSGLSMNFLLKQLEVRNPKSLKLVALISKTERRENEVKVDFVGFDKANGFLVGYGLDYAEKYRHLPAIYDLKLSN
ncbi:hypoxanthine phosphoribosyltransferase [Desulfovibrio litoralis]|uniref:Hypoxanthine phosphoribosyltransferase n=1 Tax=Desulfovibrio litoralis DSM 11393 TaxID=1121455 RepID=A0A1M7TBE2_9BACT|nr:hypoxanthine phosphoribosyltransferase [Desulfovibrio litoralis]SHN68052.1 hypoxanthine phosphoribosyltransferase [Desulfovibrio litoralis DSM 11393]